jgi:hypothetical protein
MASAKPTPNYENDNTRPQWLVQMGISWQSTHTRYSLLHRNAFSLHHIIFAVAMHACTQTYPPTECPRHPTPQWQHRGITRMLAVAVAVVLMAGTEDATGTAN